MKHAASVFQEVQNLFAEDLVIRFLHHHRVGSALDDLQARALVPKGVKSFLAELGRDIVILGPRDEEHGSLDVRRGDQALVRGDQKISASAIGTAVLVVAPAVREKRVGDSRLDDVVVDGLVLLDLEIPGRMIQLFS